MILLKNRITKWRALAVLFVMTILVNMVIAQGRAQVTVHDVAVVEVTPSRLTAEEGSIISINVTCINQGDFLETFNVTTYYESNAIGTKQTSLPAKKSSVFTFIWDTIGVSKGGYTIRACASQVLNETDTADNSLIGGTVQLTIEGDVSGNRIVDVRDLYLVGKSYGSSPDLENWNSNCDINGDWRINMSDLTSIRENYGRLDSSIPITSLITTTTQRYAGLYEQRRIFCALGRIWVFYGRSTDGAAVYRTSNDEGLTWSSETVIKAGTFSQWGISVDFDGTYVYVALSHVDIWYRRGLPSPDGTITWDQNPPDLAVDASTKEECRAPTIHVDPDGCAWIGYLLRYGDNATSYISTPFITKNARNDGRWMTSSGFPVQLSNQSEVDWEVVPLPLSSNETYILYCGNKGTSGFSHELYGRLWTSSEGMSANVTISASMVYFFTAATDANSDIHIVCKTDEGNNFSDLIYLRYDYSTSSWSTEEETIVANIAGGPSIPPVLTPTLCVDKETNDCYLFYAYQTSMIMYRRVQGVWDTDETIVQEIEGFAGSPITSVRICIVSEYVQPSTSCPSTSIGIFFISGDASPWNLKCVGLTTPYLRAP